MKIQTIRTRVFKEGEDIYSFIDQYIKKPKENAVIVVTSKIVALAERRTVAHDPKIPLTEMKEKIIRQESDYALKTKYTWLTIKDGMVMSAAGIDESNAGSKFILLPNDSFVAASNIRNYFKKKYKLKNIGVLITDSRLFPLRAGVVGAAIGYAGFKGLRDYRGTPDMFGRILQLSQTDIADSLATGAVLCMGEGREQQPIAVIEQAPVVFSERVNKRELLIDPREDVYQPLFEKIRRIKY